ncbi:MULTISPECIES: hypothetical protein [Oxalobacteraceae]|jgi:hypothetical protein|uniref:hypothetical protein n=1 Tax=Oxalobacteraceae TaxID=75682 RepID=UPI002BA07F55|nr:MULTISPECIES: hypothetical protein [Oxalobacteraceae]HTD02817.1 hypothetical protein [Undibacterium sp.]HWW08151.1 hypothetical protein [Collimonas sp.]
MKFWKAKLACSVALTCLMIPYAASAAPAAAPAVADTTQKSSADQEVQVLKDVAQARPTEKTPWVRMTQIKYEAGNYRDAVAYALQVLQRDPADKYAKGVVALGGLRLSIKALNDLGTQGDLNGSVLADAQTQTKMLRESLGETVVDPAAAAEAKPKVIHPLKKKAVRAAKAVASDAGGDGKPFGALQ